MLLGLDVSSTHIGAILQYGAEKEDFYQYYNEVDDMSYRFNLVANLLAWLDKFEDDRDVLGNFCVFLENYKMNMRGVYGNVYQTGEITGVLKYELIQRYWSPIFLIVPSKLKVFAPKGKKDKKDIIKFVEDDLGINFEDNHKANENKNYFGAKSFTLKAKADLADAYVLMYTGWLGFQERFKKHQPELVDWYRKCLTNKARAKSYIWDKFEEAHYRGYGDNVESVRAITSGGCMERITE